MYVLVLIILICHVLINDLFTIHMTLSPEISQFVCCHQVCVGVKVICECRSQRRVNRRGTVPWIKHRRASQLKASASRSHTWIFPLAVAYQQHNVNLHVFVCVSRFKMPFNSKNSSSLCYSTTPRLQHQVQRMLFLC